jgi:hypothetical protein
MLGPNLPDEPKTRASDKQNDQAAKDRFHVGLDGKPAPNIQRGAKTLLMLRFLAHHLALIASVIRAASSRASASVKEPVT